MPRGRRSLRVSDLQRNSQTGSVKKHKTKVNSKYLSYFPPVLDDWCSVASLLLVDMNPCISCHVTCYINVTYQPFRNMSRFHHNSLQQLHVGRYERNKGRSLCGSIHVGESSLQQNMLQNQVLMEEITFIRKSN